MFRDQQEEFTGLKIDCHTVLEKSGIADELRAKYVVIFEKLQSLINRLNHLLTHNSLTLFRKTKPLALKFLISETEKISTKNIDELDKTALLDALKQIHLELLKCSPPLRIESVEERNENIQQELALLRSQFEFNKNTQLLDAFAQLKSTKTVYLFHASNEEPIFEREKWVHKDFIPLLAKHLKQAGVDLVWQGRNFAGSDMRQFLNQIGECQCILTLGTESLRQQLLSNSFAVTFQTRVLLLRDLKQIDLIPYVLTGIRETSFPDEWEHTTISVWKGPTYESMLTHILCRIYGVSLERVLKNIPEKENPAAKDVSRSSSQYYTKEGNTTFFGGSNEGTSEQSLTPTVPKRNF